MEGNFVTEHLCRILRLIISDQTEGGYTWTNGQMWINSVSAQTDAKGVIQGW